MTDNYFTSFLAAKSYAAARPHIHRVALSRFIAFSGIAVPVDQALDVGCGTGLSSEALTQVARHVVGIDPSEAMLDACEPRADIEYRQSSAERIPADDSSFTLISAACVFHWLDREAFLREAYRVLRPAGWLVIYNCWFTSEMRENSSFTSWFKDEYLPRYSTPPRHTVKLIDEWTSKHGFALRGEESFSEDVRMSVQRFTEYQLSTTNVIAAVGDNRSLFEQTRQWIEESLAPYFDGALERTFVFGLRSWYLQRLGNEHQT